MIQINRKNVIVQVIAGVDWPWNTGYVCADCGRSLMAWWKAAQ